MKKSKPNLIKTAIAIALLVSCAGFNLNSAQALDRSSVAGSPYFAQVESRGQEATSGFVDEDGRPLSQEEYDKIRADLEKGIFEKYPVPSALVGIAIIGGIVWLVRKKIAKRG